MCRPVRTVGRSTVAEALTGESVFALAFVTAGGRGGVVLDASVSSEAGAAVAVCVFSEAGQAAGLCARRAAAAPVARWPAREHRTRKQIVRSRPRQRTPHAATATIRPRRHHEPLGYLFARSCRTISPTSRCSVGE